MSDMPDFKKAYFLWLENYHHQEAEKLVLPVLQIPKRRGWLKLVREALLTSTNQAAKACGVSKTTYIRLEQSEAAGTINMASLERAAEALGCELVYALRPKTRLSFSQTIWQRIQPLAIDHTWVKSRPQNKKPLALAAVAKWRMLEPKVRRRLLWTERKNNGQP